MAKIKHLALICMDPDKMAQFYCEVFDMKVMVRRLGAVHLSDGYMNLALLPQRAEGKAQGLNHFGFQVDDRDVIDERLKKWNVVGPVARPENRTYAETRGTDPEGNNFDLSVGGFQRSRQPAETEKEPEAV
jgi:catechol 2,3-dioxygenase-like lactoylglutathione lyase family enzyme